MARNQGPQMPSSDIVDRKRCGGTLWKKVDDHFWDKFTQGHVVPFPFESVWCISPTRTPVSCQAGSLESILCICANFGQTMRIENLLTHERLEQNDIHPAARADTYLYLQDKDSLAKVLINSPEAREYISSLNPLHIQGPVIEWAQEFCRLIEAREAASDAAYSC